MISRYERFTTMISAIYHHIQRIEREEMVRTGGRGAFAQYLTALRSHPEGLTAAQLSELIDRDKAAVSRTIAQMEAQGLIMRSGDQLYRARLTLTDEGQRTAEFVCSRVEAAMSAGGQGLTDAHREALYTALDLIEQNLEAICKEGIPES